MQRAFRIKRHTFCIFRSLLSGKSDRTPFFIKGILREFGIEVV